MTSTGLQATEVERRVISMYEKHPFPAIADKFRKASEEMFLKMRLLGLAEPEYTKKSVLDCGCGTGEFTCWYAARGNNVTAIDLSRSSLQHAKAYAQQYGLQKNIRFARKSVLDMDLPDNAFDLVYSYGVLHHTPDPYQGFKEMVRVCKPGGIVIVSVYNLYSRYIIRLKQRIISQLAGDDIELRYQLGKRLFPITARKLKLRAHDDSNAVLYDQFSIPHESLHTAGEILKWLSANKLEYLGSFGPLRLRDYIRAAALPEYKRIEVTFDGYPMARIASATLKSLAQVLRFHPEQDHKFQIPGRTSLAVVQSIWCLLGLRFSCFSIAGRKPLETE